MNPRRPSSDGSQFSTNSYAGQNQNEKVAEADQDSSHQQLKELEPSSVPEASPHGQPAEAVGSANSSPGSPPQMQRIKWGDYEKIETLSGHTRSVTVVKFSPDGEFLASASADCSIIIWNTKDFKCERTIIGHERGINDISWNSRGDNLASCSDDRLVRIFNVSDGKCLKTFKGHTSYVLSCCFNPQSTLIVSAGFDEILRLWDVYRGTCLKAIPAHTNVITCVSFNNTGSLIASSGYDGCIRIWDVMDGGCLKTLKDVCDKPISLVQFTPNGKFLLSSHETSTHKIWGITDVKPRKYYYGHTNLQYFIHACLSVSHGINLISGSEDGKIYIWDLNSQKVKLVIDDHPTAVLGVTTHPTLDMIATGGAEPDNTIRIWQANP